MSKLLYLLQIDTLLTVDALFFSLHLPWAVGGERNALPDHEPTAEVAGRAPLLLRVPGGAGDAALLLERGLLSARPAPECSLAHRLQHHQLG